MDFQAMNLQKTVSYNFCRLPVLGWFVHVQKILYICTLSEASYLWWHKKLKHLCDSPPCFVELLAL